MNVMFDLETMGTSPDTIVLSLGAVAFNKNGILGEKLWKFSLLDQQRLGRTWDASTLQWWMRQSEDAREVFQPDDFEVTIEEYFEEFHEWVVPLMESQDEGFDQLKPWGQGANFDVAIMENIYKQHHENGDFATPWNFWNVRCHRTFKELTRCDQLVLRKGTHHDALDDARYQAECVLHILQGKHKQGKKK